MSIPICFLRLQKYSAKYLGAVLSVIIIGSFPLYGENYYLETDKSVSPNAIYQNGCGLSPEKTTVTLTVSGVGDCPTGGPLDIILIIDRSSTMLINARIDSAKAAAKAFIDLLRDQDRASLVTFATDATLNKGLTQMNAAGKADLKTAVDTIQALGWTNIGDAISTANHHFLDQGWESRSWVEILLSDGLPNMPTWVSDPEDYALTEADTAKILDIPIYTIG